jgi:ubiquinone/menaquinone biosynthesis C-methylase UbiE
MRTRDYYDEFAAWYERERGRGYHQLIDDLEVDLVERYGRGAEVLEAGCGTGLILGRVAGFAGAAWGLDLSGAMLARAQQRRLRVVQASLTAIPFPDQRFDVVYAFKVLAHVERIREACAELARVTRRGGYLLLEFYNPRSLRFLVKSLKRPTPISASARVDDHQVFTRYDTLDTIRTYLPPDCHVVTMRGVRVVTPVAQVYRIPPLGRVFGALERKLADAPVFRRLGGFLIVVAQRA